MHEHFTEDDVEPGEQINWTKQPHFASQIGGLILGVILIPFGGIGLLLLASIYLNLKYTTYSLTNKALYKKTGWLSDTVQRVSLEKIQDTEYSQSWAEKKFGFGTIDFSTAGGSGTELQFRAISDPQKSRKEINELSSKLEEKKKVSNQVTQTADQQELARELKETRENLEKVIELLE